MVTLEEITVIHAPVERCFDLARSIDLHIESTACTREEVIAGVTCGLVGPGQEVIWRARHLGFSRTMTLAIAAFDPPRFFEDRMTTGSFRSFEHGHYFTDRGDGFIAMRDLLSFAAPFAPLTEPFLEKYLLRLLRERNQLLRRLAESKKDWVRYLSRP